MRLQKLKMCTWEYRGGEKYFTSCVYNFAHKCAWFIGGGNYVATKNKKIQIRGYDFADFLPFYIEGYKNFFKKFCTAPRTFRNKCAWLYGGV